jgi:hypothetical protein
MTRANHPGMNESHQGGEATEQPHAHQGGEATEQPHGDSGGEHNHEHPDVFIAEPFVSPHVFAAIGGAVEGALQSNNKRAEAYRALGILAEYYDQLQNVARLTPRVACGDTVARDAVSQWMTELPQQDPYDFPGEAKPSASEPAPPPHHHDVPASNQDPSEDPGTGVFSLAPLVDLLTSASLVGFAGSEKTRTVRGAVEAFLLHVPLIGQLYERAREYASRTTAGEAFLLAVDPLLEIEAKRCCWPNSHEAASDRQGQMPHSARAVIQKTKALMRYWLGEDIVTSLVSLTRDDKNSRRIADLTPRIASPGEIVTLHASRGEPFESQGRPVEVCIGTAAAPVIIKSWSPMVVTIEVPEDAVTGPLMFRRQIGETELEILEKQTATLASLLGQCWKPTYLATHGLPFRVPTPQYAGCAEVTVVHKPKIQSFAHYREGSRHSGNEHPETGALVGWRLDSDDLQPATISLYAGHRLIGESLPLQGRMPADSIDWTGVSQIEIVARNRAGTTVGSLRSPAPAQLRISPDPVFVARGSMVLIQIHLPRAVDSLTITSDDPGRVAVIGAMPLNLDRSIRQAYVWIRGVASADPGQVLAHLTASAEGCWDATVAVWEDHPAGRWEVQGEVPGMVPIHAALLPTGKVLFFAGQLDDYNNVNQDVTQVWDPARGFTSVTMDPRRNLFCSHHCFLADGTLLVAGGNAFPGWFAWGADHDVHTFDPFTETWQRFADMVNARWYPTCTTLPNGHALIVSGSAGGGTGNPTYWVNEDLDLFDLDGGLQDIPRTRFISHRDIYPHMFVLPGDVLFFFARDVARLFYPNDTAGPLGRTVSSHQYATVSRTTRTYPGQGPSVLLPLIPNAANEVERARVLVIGGGGPPSGGRIERAEDPDEHSPASARCEIFEYVAGQGRETRQRGWRETGTLNVPRFMADGILLPDGTVLVVSGAGVGIVSNNSDPVLTAEIFDPATERWSRMTDAAVPRQYHSTALLLPDGRVVTAGSTGGWPPSVQERRLEVFYPPYLFRGERPVIEHAPAEILYNESFQIASPHAADVGSVTLLRVSSVTHSLNTDQRIVELLVERPASDTLLARAPIDGAVAPPGYYMLFIRNRRNIPSIGWFVRLDHRHRPMR